MANPELIAVGVLDHATEVFEVEEGGIPANEIVLNDTKLGKIFFLVTSLSCDLFWRERRLVMCIVLQLKV